MSGLLMRAVKVVRYVIFAQASLSHLGENSRSWPKFLLELLLRCRTLVLSEVLSRSGERGSPKRERVRAYLCFTWLWLRREAFPWAGSSLA